MMSVLLNITSWIVYTFESKGVESFFSETTYFGDTLWMIISHVTLPLMLFYRFHASVCLADVWKFAYESSNDTDTTRDDHLYHLHDEHQIRRQEKKLHEEENQIITGVTAGAGFFSSPSSSPSSSSSSFQAGKYDVRRT